MLMKEWQLPVCSMIEEREKRGRERGTSFLHSSVAFISSSILKK